MAPLWIDARARLGVAAALARRIAEVDTPAVAKFQATLLRKASCWEAHAASPNAVPEDVLCRAESFILAMKEAEAVLAQSDRQLLLSAIAALINQRYDDQASRRVVSYRAAARLHPPGYRTTAVQDATSYLLDPILTAALSG